MKVVLIGVGQAGGKLTQALTEFDDRMGFDAVQGALAINSASADLQPLSIDRFLIGRDRVKGHGVGGDNVLGAEVMQSDAVDVMTSLDGRITSRAEAIVVVAGLGGGTGSGGAPVLARELKRVYDLPVYVLGILPGHGEGAMYQANAGRSLTTTVREADSTILIDNDAWHHQGESVAEAFEAINEKIAQRIGLLLAAGEVIDGVAESVVDSSEIINTLRPGGIAAVGFASATASEDAGENVNTIASLTRRAVMTGMSLPKSTKAEAALVIVAGEPGRISRKGVEAARRFVEDETGSMQVRGGDFPLESDRIASIVVLGGVQRSKRIAQFVARAKEAQRRVTKTKDEHVDHFTVEELEDLF